MGKNAHIVSRIVPGSIAEEMGIEPGDAILKINGQDVEDIFDYQFLLDDSNVVVLVKKKNTEEEWELEIEKDPDEDLGVEFENSLMDDYKSCSNHCVFCFIDQMPKGMRKTLYFKDDDSRLSFLQGNYVTLTNMSDHDIDRIIRYRMEPINISFQTTNPELRRKMLHNRFAGDVFPKVRKLADAGIILNGQIVLCKNLNDGQELERTIRDLTEYLPALHSVSVVPVGLSRFRDGLYPLEPFNKEDAEKVIDCIEAWQRKLFPRYGIHFMHASDEWYLLAGRDLPEEERYDGYLQLENGVGMLRLLDTEVREEMEDRRGDDRRRNITIATGQLAADTIRRLCELMQTKYPNVHVQVVTIRNDFFGERITVSGLITGTDLIRQLKGRDLGEELLIPCNMLRSGENVFLDDITVEQVILELKVPVEVVDSEGKDLCLAVLGEKKGITHKRRQMYEQTDCSGCGTT
ncbi:MAG: DUF512 domain-containing protein [Bilifractor sp.]